MNKTEMLNKLLERAGWTVTTETDEDGYAKCVAPEAEKKEKDK